MPSMPSMPQRMGAYSGLMSKVDGIANRDSSTSGCLRREVHATEGHTDEGVRLPYEALDNEIPTKRARCVTGSFL